MTVTFCKLVRDFGFFLFLLLPYREADIFCTTLEILQVRHNTSYFFHYSEKNKVKKQNEVWFENDRFIGLDQRFDEVGKSETAITDSKRGCYSWRN